MPSPLRILADLISNAVTKIDKEYADANLEFPSLKDIFDPKDLANVLLSKQSINENINILAAAAEQLVASVRTPPAILWDMALMVCYLQYQLLDSKSDSTVSMFDRHVSRRLFLGAFPKSLEKLAQRLDLLSLLRTLDPNHFHRVCMFKKSQKRTESSRTSFVSQRSDVLLLLKVCSPSPSPTGCFARIH